MDPKSFELTLEQEFELERWKKELPPPDLLPPEDLPRVVEKYQALLIQTMQLLMQKDNIIKGFMRGGF